ncbi:hypothetical protein GCM10020258_17740 [Sphingomonas yabuuchiae]
MSAIIVTGTDTEIGKTVFSAALTGALGASYWKPVQAGTDEEGMAMPRRSPRSVGARFSLRLSVEDPLLAAPCSRDRRGGDRDGPAGPAADRWSAGRRGAGGVLVPVTRQLLFADLFAHWGRPVVLVARTGLGTINHSLLSIEALRSRGVPILGSHSSARVWRTARRPLPRSAG